jgi:uncharacterized protein (TIGR02217 family)
MAFIETQFPTQLALSAVGGPGYSTSVNAAFSGYEQRNQNWSQSRAEYTVSFEHKNQTDYDALLAMFHAARGQANSFRLFDHSDCSVTGQFIATGDGSTKTFQLQKTYTFPNSDFEVTRPVQKPITSLITDFYGNALTDTVNVYVNASLKSHNAGYVSGGGVNYTLDATTGIISFATAPAMSAVITADFQFHVPVRFELDQYQSTKETSKASGILYTVTGIKLVEVRIPLGQAS